MTSTNSTDALYKGAESEGIRGVQSNPYLSQKFIFMGTFGEI